MGAPPGFSPGDTWTFPLVDPLSDGRLLTPVYVEGRGPYLFAIDPDAPRTVIDSEVVAVGEFRARSGPRMTDEHDVTHPTFYAQVTNLAIGDLRLSLRTVQVSQNGTFDNNRRRIYGVIGRDVVADSLVFGFNRDFGIAWLKTQEVFHPPSDADVIEYFKGTRARPDLVVRRLVNVNINGASYDLHLDLGDVASQLRPEHWQQAKLRSVGWNMTLIDEVGTHREVSEDGIADRVTAGGVTREKIGFVPYDDRRWDFGQLEGTLGLDFFRPFSVAADWHHERFYLTPRSDSSMETASRVARWGDRVPSSCRNTGCMTITVTPATPEAEAIVHVVRDPAAAKTDLEIIVAATAPSGASLPRFYISLPAGTDEITTPIETRYDHATFAAIDISPFPFHCTGCIVSDEPLPP